MDLKKHVLIILIILFNGILVAQTEEDDWWDDDSWNENLDLDVDVWSSEANPFIELNFGNGKALHNYISNDIFNSLGNMELKLGYSSVDILSEGYVDEFNDNYFFISNFSKDLSYKKSNGILKPELWQFGFAKRDGYGYKTEYFSVHPYHAGGIVWSRLKVSAPDIRTFAPVPQNALARFNEEFRFGTVNEGGINLGFGDGFVSLNAGYKLDVIFPRYLIWKHLGSLLIEQAAQKGLDTFIDAIMDHSSAAGPIVNVLLKNGLTYALYTLKKENMNWPFNTEAPLTFETLKLGITFTF